MKHNESQYLGLLYRIFPFLEWLKGYQMSFLKGDLIAGITVAVVLIPQAMAYAMLAGMPPVYGLYAAAVTPLIGVLWGSLRQLATGQRQTSKIGADKVELLCRDIGHVGISEDRLGEVGPHQDGTA